MSTHESVQRAPLSRPQFSLAHLTVLGLAPPEMINRIAPAVASIAKPSAPS